MPFPIIAAANIASGLISGIFGAGQRKRGNQMMADNPRPDMVIPEAELQNKALAEQYAREGMPQAQYARNQQGISRNANAALAAAGDRRSGLGMLGRIQGSANDAQLNLDIADAAAVNKNRQNLMNTNNQLAQWQNKVWDWNKRQKYMETAATARALLGAGNTNLFGGIDRGLAGAGWAELLSGLTAKKAPTNSSWDAFGKSFGNMSLGTPTPPQQTYQPIGGNQWNWNQGDNAGAGDYSFGQY